MGTSHHSIIRIISRAKRGSSERPNGRCRPCERRRPRLKIDQWLNERNTDEEIVNKWQVGKPLRNIKRCTSEWRQKIADARVPAASVENDYELENVPLVNNGMRTAHSTPTNIISKQHRFYIVKWHGMSSWRNKGRRACIDTDRADFWYFSAFTNSFSPSAT